MRSTLETALVSYSYVWTYICHSNQEPLHFIHLMCLPAIELELLEEIAQALLDDIYVPNPETLETLFFRVAMHHYAELQNLARRMLHSDDPDDVGGHVNRSLLEGYRLFCTQMCSEDGGGYRILLECRPDPFLAFIGQIIRRRASDVNARRARRPQFLTFEEDYLAPSHGVAEVYVQIKQFCQQLFEKLSGNRRAVAVCFVQGMDAKQIADRLDLGQSTVFRHLAVIKELFRAFFEKN